MRKYRLEAMLAALLGLAVLFIWKNASSFGPCTTPIEPGTAIGGRDAAEGLMNLLRRNIPARDLLGLCFEEWTKSLGAGSSYPIARVDRAQLIIEAENQRARMERNPVKAYLEICRVLAANRAEPEQLQADSVNNKTG